MQQFNYGKQEFYIHSSAVPQYVSTNQISVSLGPTVSKCLFLRIVISVADLRFVNKHPGCFVLDRGQESIFYHFGNVPASLMLGLQACTATPTATSVLQPACWHCLVWWHARGNTYMCVHNQGCSDSTWHNTGWCCQGEHRFIMHWTLHSCLVIACSETFIIAKFLWPP